MVFGVSRSLGLRVSRSLGSGNIRGGAARFSSVMISGRRAWLLYFWEARLGFLRGRFECLVRAAGYRFLESLIGPEGFGRGIDSKMWSLFLA